MNQIINRIQKQLGNTVSFKVFFENPTIEGISGQLQENIYSAIPKAPKTDCYPLTASQSRLWVLSQLEGGSMAYNMPAAVRLTGVLDVIKFKTSFSKLMVRHEILRTSFKTDEEGVVSQYILPSDQIDFTIQQENFSLEENQQKSVTAYLQEN